MMRAATFALFILLAGCDATGVLVPVSRGDFGLWSGQYAYDAYSDWGGIAYWGYLNLRVDTDGRITGTYRLPRQCSDRWGYEVDCAGYIGGRVYDDGSFRFGMDEGWLANRGTADSRGRAAGRWETRLLGGRGAGTFEMFPR